MESSDSNTELREQAVKRLHAKRDFMGHLATYIGVSVLLVAIWALTGGTDEFFWPIFPIVGWGVFGVVPHWWTTYKDKGISEDQIQAEMNKINKERGAGS